MYMLTHTCVCVCLKALNAHRQISKIYLYYTTQLDTHTGKYMIHLYDYVIYVGKKILKKQIYTLVSTCWGPWLPLVEEEEVEEEEGESGVPCGNSESE